MDNRQMWMEQILRLLELATEEQLRLLYTAALYSVRAAAESQTLGILAREGRRDRPFSF